MTRIMTVSALAFGLVASSGPLFAQKVQVEPEQRYLVLEVMKLSTLERELNEAAEQGFRLVLSTTSDDGQRVQALMERAAEPPDVFHYRLVATFEVDTGDREVNAAAAQGYRAIPNTTIIKKGITVFNTNRVVVMEKAPDSTSRMEYRTLTAIRTGTFHRDLKAAVDEGWSVHDMTYGQILLERARVMPTAPSAGRR